MRYLAIDLGSTFIKGAVLDLEAGSLEPVGRVRFPDPQSGGEGWRREFDPAAIVEATRGVLDLLAARAPEACGVVLCSQLHGMVFTSREGEALSPAITWQDQRGLLPLPGGGGSYFDELNRRLGPAVRRELGNEPRPGVPLCFLFWLRETGGMPSRGAIPASLANHVVASLGRTAPVSDLTNAFAHGALDIRSGDWHRGALESLRLGELEWPRIVAQGSVIAEYRTAAGRRLPIHAPVGDYHCSQVGAFLEEGELSVNISTGSAVIQVANGPEQGDFQTRPWFDGRFLKTVTHIPGGRALNALVQLCTELVPREGGDIADPWPQILARAEASGPSDLRLDPAFYFSATGDRGSLRNMREENLTVGHLFRAAFEGMAENYDRCATRINPARDWRRVVFSGGVALKTRLLRELILRRLGAAHRIAPCEEDTLAGLLCLAMAFSGRAPTVAEAMRELRPRFNP
ncbi:MAG TPA: hypothetical protein DCM86_14470 [Verrucomicrobiales bacterium]|nr:hypothetical protein [Verrucomicrobiales bacterium]